MKKERVDVRLEQELLDELDIIAQRSGFSRSGAIREAIASYVDEQKHGWNSTSLRINIPNRLAERVERAIMNSDAKDIDGAVEKALDFWTRDLEDYYLNRRPKLEEITAENIRKDRAVTSMKEETNRIARK